MVIWLVCLLAGFLGYACCKISGDADEDAERCFEEWLKAKEKDSSS